MRVAIKLVHSDCKKVYYLLCQIKLSLIVQKLSFPVVLKFSLRKMMSHMCAKIIFLCSWMIWLFKFNIITKHKHSSYLYTLRPCSHVVNITVWAVEGCICLHRDTQVFFESPCRQSHCSLLLLNASRMHLGPGTHMDITLEAAALSMHLLHPNWQQWDSLWMRMHGTPMHPRSSKHGPPWVYGF